jgi:hypothetical protein
MSEVEQMTMQKLEDNLITPDFRGKTFKRQCLCEITKRMFQRLNELELLAGESYPGIAADMLKLQNRVKELEGMLRINMTALDDWLHVLAPYECDEKHVNGTRKRLNKGGTIYYLANIQQQNRQVLAGKE